MKRFAIVLAIVAILYVLFFNPIRFQWLPFGKQQTSADVTNQVEQINVDVSNVRTEVKLGNGNKVKAELRGRGKVSVQKTGDTIQVGVSRYSSVFSWWNRDKLTITLPRSYNKSMMLHAGSATLNFDGGMRDQTYREFAANVSSGSMNVSHVMAKSFQAEVKSGNLNLDRLTADSADLNVQSGNLGVKHFTGPIVAQVNSGNLNMGIDALRGRIRVSVNSGLAQLDLPNNADFRLNGTSSSGMIRCSISLKNKQSDENGISGIQGTGKYKVNVQVNSGVVRIH
jgi:lia operon protein LiaG